MNARQKQRMVKWVGWLRKSQTIKGTGQLRRPRYGDEGTYEYCALGGACLTKTGKGKFVNGGIYFQTDPGINTDSGQYIPEGVRSYYGIEQRFVDQIVSWNDGRKSFDFIADRLVAEYGLTEAA